MKTNLLILIAILTVIGCLVFGPYLFALIVYTVFYMAFLGLKMIPAMYWALGLIAAVAILIACGRGRT